MTHIDALLNASTANDLFFEKLAPFVARVSQYDTAIDTSFTVVIEMVVTAVNGYLPRRHIATISDISDSCYGTADAIVRTWNLTRNPTTF